MGGDRRRGRDRFGVNLGRPILINGEGDAVFQNYFGEDLFTQVKAIGPRTEGRRRMLSASDHINVSKKKL